MKHPVAYFSCFVLMIAMLMYFDNIYSNTKQKKAIIITICVATQWQIDW